MIDADPTAAGGFDLVLVDPGDSTMTTLTHGVCSGAVDLSDDGSLLAYATCPPNRTADMASDLHLMDMNTRVDREVGPIAGRAWRILISPTTDQFMIHRLKPADGTLPTLIVDKDGSSRELAEGWIPVGWQGRSRVVLADDWEVRHLSVANVETGELRDFYPTAR